MQECLSWHFVALQPDGHVVRMGEMRNAHEIFVGKPEGKRPLGRPTDRWADSIRIDRNEIGWEVVDWIHLAQDAGSCEHGNEFWGSIKGEFLD